MTYIQRIRKAKIFEGLTNQQFMALEEMGHEEEYKRGDYLYRQGDPAENMYVVLKGKVKVMRHAPTGAVTIIGIYSIGDELTAHAVLEGRPYPTSARALTDVAVFRVPKRYLRKILAEWPIVCGNLMRDLSSKYRELMDNFTSLAVYRGEGRLCKVIANLAKRYGIFGDKRGVILDLALTRQDLADITGTTLETTIRTLNRLKGEGLITWEGKRFFIPDLSALENAPVSS